MQLDDENGKMHITINKDYLAQNINYFRHNPESDWYTDLIYK